MATTSAESNNEQNNNRRQTSLLNKPRVNELLAYPGLDNDYATDIRLLRAKHCHFSFAEADHTNKGKLESGLASSPKLDETMTKKLDEIMKKSNLSILESPKNIEPLKMGRQSRRNLKRSRKADRLKTRGPGWFNMGAPEVTSSVKNDLEALKLRGALDTKRFYKRNNISIQPKYFQLGRVIETPADYYSSRIPKKLRKSTLADELVADLE